MKTHYKTTNTLLPRWCRYLCPRGAVLQMVSETGEGLDTVWGLLPAVCVSCIQSHPWAHRSPVDWAHQILLSFTQNNWCIQKSRASPSFVFICEYKGLGFILPSFCMFALCVRERNLYPICVSGNSCALHLSVVWLPSSISLLTILVANLHNTG